ncbi:hypothetical protein ACP275_08G228600 [Erythranthe tilingii]
MRGTHRLFSYIKPPLHQTPFLSRHLLDVEGSRYVSSFGGSQRNIYSRVFGFECRGLLSNNGSCSINFARQYSTHNAAKNIYSRTFGFVCRGLMSNNGSCSVNFGRRYSTHNNAAATTSMEKKSNKMLLYLTGLVFAMVGCSYAAVPLYRRFCQATGYGGTVQRRESVEEKIARHSKDGTVASREIVVQFNADVADGMPWKFVPTQREVRVKPGESALAFYTAENKSAAPITGVSTYNVTPMKAAVYFNKIQCFCFEEQRLLPGEQIDMPVFFYIDPEFETDPKMEGINNLILSYTFFKVSEEK